MIVASGVAESQSVVIMLAVIVPISVPISLIFSVAEIRAHLALPLSVTLLRFNVGDGVIDVAATKYCVDSVDNRTNFS